jgi:hypothetical protein
MMNKEFAGTSAATTPLEQLYGNTSATAGQSSGNVTDAEREVLHTKSDQEQAVNACKKKEYASRLPTLAMLPSKHECAEVQ